MKFMHFKASCSYTALANLLELEGLDTEDDQIALDMGLPWIFARDGDTYLAGPMLQGAKWFDLWLKPKGFAFRENTIKTEVLPETLQHSGPCMFGMQKPYGKHAVVFTGYDGYFHLLNPTYENSGEATELVMSAQELTAAVDSAVTIGCLRRAASNNVNLHAVWEASIPVLRQNVAEIAAFASTSHAPDAYMEALNRLFRPLLLDGITMLELAGEMTFSTQLRELQAALMRFMRTDRCGILAEALPVPVLRDLAQRYEQLIVNNQSKQNKQAIP